MLYGNNTNTSTVNNAVISLKTIKTSPFYTLSDIKYYKKKYSYKMQIT